MLTLNLGGIAIMGIMIFALLWLVWQPRFNRVLRLFNKPIVIRNQVQWLSRKLLIRYGLREYYTPAQVQRTIRESGYSTIYDCYGLAMYCDASDFIDFHRSIGESCNYLEMRHEISNYLSLPNASFSTSDIIDFGMSLNSSYSGNSCDNYHASSHDLQNWTSGHYHSGEYDGGYHSGSCDSSSGHDGGGGCDAGSGGYQ
jgi:hypothetical protein